MLKPFELITYALPYFFKKQPSSGLSKDPKLGQQMSKNKKPLKANAVINFGLLLGYDSNLRPLGYLIPYKQV